MIILRDKLYSAVKKTMLDKIVAKLEKDKIDDYEISKKVSTDSISISSNLDDLKIYIPIDFEYEQYRIDDFIRHNFDHNRTSTNLDRNIYVMKLNNKLTEDQYYKLVKHLIEEEEFLTILEN